MTEILFVNGSIAVRDWDISLRREDSYMGLSARVEVGVHTADVEEIRRTVTTIDVLAYSEEGLLKGHFRLAVDDRTPFTVDEFIDHRAIFTLERHR